MTANPIKDLEISEKKARYVKRLRATGNRRDACTYAGWKHINSPLEHAKRDPVFAEDVEHAWQDAVAAFEVVARQRALVGYEEPVVYQGKLQYKTDETGEVVRDKDGQLVPLTITKYSDPLLQTMLKAHHPMYKDNIKHDITIRKSGVLLLTSTKVPEGLSVEEAFEAEIADHQAQYRLPPPEGDKPVLDAEYVEVHTRRDTSTEDEFEKAMK